MRRLKERTGRVLSIDWTNTSWTPPITHTGPGSHDARPAVVPEREVDQHKTAEPGQALTHQ